MKVLLVNGSPHKEGCTYTALSEVARVLSDEGVDSDIIHIGAEPIAGCRGCGVCKERGKCVIDDDVNLFVEQAREADGFVFGTPVHFAAATGALTTFLDRVFYSAPADTFYLKPGAAVVSSRRAGTTAAFEQVNKYFTIREMPVISSRYWNMVHGYTPDDARKDAEGMQAMRILARNMAWFLRCKEAGKAAGVALPEREKTVMTNFIR
jgi:multimeric flavodoxin WrbA